jgi:hypothetical protein
MPLVFRAIADIYICIYSIYPVGAAVVAAAPDGTVTALAALL